MKVEQRIGRIDRIGQRHRDISVLNLCYADSAEEVVYGRLLARLQEAGMIVGTQQLSLLPVTPEEFAKLADKTLSAEALQRQAMKRAEAARQRTESMEMSPLELYQIYERLAEQTNQTPTPVDIAAIWQTLCESTYLQQLGCRCHGDAQAQVLTLAHIPGAAADTAVTTSWTTFEVGLAGFEGRLHFATYGDPIFEAILQQIETFPPPACIQRLEVEIPEASATVVGYAVAERGADGRSGCRLVTSWRELATLSLDEAANVSADDGESLHQRLSAMAREELAMRQAVPRINAINEQAAHAQRLLGYLVARGLLQSRLQTGAAEVLFWREVQALEGICQGRDVLRVRHIPTALGRRLTSLLFDLDLPSVGEEGYVDAPPPLIQAALDAMCRLANGLKRRRADLTTAEVLSRLEREIERLSS
jgi:hypothetical protein